MFAVEEPVDVEEPVRRRIVLVDAVDVSPVDGVVVGVVDAWSWSSTACVVVS